MPFRRSSSPPGRKARAARDRRSTAAPMPSFRKPSSYVKPITYGAVAPGLFDAIVANRAPRTQLPQLLRHRASFRNAAGS